jgi:hypothetical protein
MNGPKNMFFAFLYDVATITNDIELIKDAVKSYKKAKNIFFGPFIFLTKLGKLLAYQARKNPEVFIKTLDVFDSIKSEDYYHILHSFFIPLCDLPNQKKQSNRLQNVIGEIISRLKTKGVAQDFYLSHVIQSICNSPIQLTKKNTDDLYELCQKVLNRYHRISSLGDLCKVYYKIGEEKKVEALLHECILLVKDPKKGDSRSTDGSSEKNDRETTRKLRDMIRNKAILIDKKLDEEGKPFYDTYTAQDVLFSSLRNDETHESVDYLMMLHEIFFCVNKKKKAKEFYNMTIKLLNDLPDFEKGRKYLSFSSKLSLLGLHTLSQSLEKNGLRIIMKWLKTVDDSNLQKHEGTYLWVIFTGFLEDKTKSMTDRIKQINNCIDLIDDVKIKIDIYMKLANFAGMKTHHLQAQQFLKKAHRYLTTEIKKYIQLFEKDKNDKKVAKQFYDWLFVQEKFNLAQIECALYSQKIPFMKKAVEDYENFSKMTGDPIGFEDLFSRLSSLESNVVLNHELVQRLVDIANSSKDPEDRVENLTILSNLLAKNVIWK